MHSSARFIIGAMDALGLLKTAASGMEAQRAALEVAARNVAAAEAAGPHGSYERLVPDFRLVEGDGDAPQVAYTGAHPQRGSNVDVLTEMLCVMNASRAFEANASIFDVGKRLAERTIDMGRL
ncbi:MAG: flagellar basal body rod C-terminal domain-containing protein [Vulcanimicrobiaceae bacterium]